MKQVFLCSGVLLLLAGCGNLSEREERLQQKDAELRAREKALHRQEENLKVRENELRTRDERSKAAAPDSVIRKYLGHWSVKMACIESTCAGSVVGDTKSESWLLSVRGTMLIAKVMVNKQIVRLYTGHVNDDGATLFEDIEATAEDHSAKITISLGWPADGVIEGTRVIAREAGCTIVYEVHMKQVQEGKRK